MTERKMIIIEKAVDLFAEKGYAATSVQDITNACGISKGAFYLSFKTKDDLLLEIFKYFSNKLSNRMTEAMMKSIEPDARLELFYQIYFEEIARYSNFILMYIREQTKTLNDEMIHVLNDFKKRTYEQQSMILTSIYGAKIEKHLPDLHVLINGILSGYMEIIIFNKDTLNFYDLAKYLVTITNSIIENLEEPFLQEEQILGFSVSLNEKLASKSNVLTAIEQLMLQPLDDHIMTTLEIIKEEVEREHPRKPLLTGMMSNLKEAKEAIQFVQLLQNYITTLT